jgi:hypothetical protein
LANWNLGGSAANIPIAGVCADIQRVITVEIEGCSIVVASRSNPGPEARMGGSGEISVHIVEAGVEKGDLFE